MPKVRKMKTINGVLYQKCSQCAAWLEATRENFYYRNKQKKILNGFCISCASLKRKEYVNKNVDYIKEWKRDYYQDNKETLRKTCKKWRDKNKETITIKRKKYYEENKKDILKKQKKYRQNNREKLNDYFSNNREKLLKQNKEYNKIHRERLRKLNREYNNSLVSFAIYRDKLTIEEDPKKGVGGKLMVKCAYCGKYFYPLYKSVKHRLGGLRGYDSGESRLYCSDGCKTACPVFNQHTWPKGFKPATSREVDPLIRQMCLERDDYTCQKCGKTIDEIELHSHHIEGATQMPMLSNDVGNTITLCKPCHKWVHKQSGCTYYDLRCRK